MVNEGGQVVVLVFRGGGGGGGVGWGCGVNVDGGVVQSLMMILYKLHKATMHMETKSKQSCPKDGSKPDPLDNQEHSQKFEKGMNNASTTRGGG